MSKGKAIVDVLRQQGYVSHETASEWAHIYTTSLIKDPDWDIGDRLCLPDGRVFRYAKSGAALMVDYGVKFAEDEFQGITTIKTAADVGATQLELTAGSHAAVDKDELKGGYIIIFHTGGGGDTQFRGIIGNEAVALNTDLTVYLDGPLDHAVIAATTQYELFYNPYASLVQGASISYSFAGKPAVEVDATATYFWVQTWGPCWIAPNLTDSNFATPYNRAAYWRHDGSIEAYVVEGTRNNENVNQLAGFLINEGYSSGPLLMLQISP